MLSLDLPDPGRLPHPPSALLPDLTKNITRAGDQYCEAGGFGDVFRCWFTNKDGAKEVAVKAFRFKFSVDEDKHDEGKAARMIRRELGIWRRLSHRNIVPFLGIAYGFGRQGSASLVSLWMPHGTLHAFLEAHDDRLAVAHRLQLLLDIASGLGYLHSLPMVHGDLSSNNVLLDHTFNACLTDFGCASLVGELPEGFTYLKTSTVRPGTLRWAAPEHFSFDEEEAKHTIKSDIYSFGNMALFVLSVKYPWSEVRTDAAVMLRLSQGLKPGRPLARPIDDRHWALVERCWSSIPERPLAEDVVSSLQQLLGTCVPPPPLCELLGVLAPSPSVPNRSDDSGIRHPLPEDVHDHVEEISHGGAKSGRPDSNSSGGSAKLEHVRHSVSTPDERVIDQSSDGPRLISKWVRGELLGRGMYGRVYLAVDSSTGEMFAVKQVDKRDRGTQRLNFVSELKMEREILRGVRHPHIIAYLGSEETTSSMSLFMEYIPGGSIAGCLREHGRFKEDVIKSFTAQIFDGLVYLHANHIIHRNIEANNVLVDLSGICKLSGFGNAQRINNDRASRAPLRGTVFWTAPEVARSQGRKPYSPQSDVWSAGCVLLKMWTGGRAWRDGDVLASMVKNLDHGEQTTSRGTSLPLPSDVILSDVANDFSNRCFAIDPEARASATELLRHPYLTLQPDWVFTGFK